MKQADIEKMATDVAAELGKLRNEQWTVSERADEDNPPYPWVIIAGPGGARIKIIYGWYSPERVTAVGLYPADTHGKEIKANTDPAHAADRIARTISNRVLGGGYVDQLLPAMAKRAQLDANSARAGLLLRRAAEMFGDVPTDGERVYLNTRLVGGGTVEVHRNNWPGAGEPDGYTLNLTGIPEEIALAMLAVLAARTTPRPTCCKDFPNHPEHYARLGCEIYASAPLVKPLNRSHEGLYGKYLESGDWQQIAWDEWLSQC